MQSLHTSDGSKIITAYRNLSQIVTLGGALKKDGRNLNTSDLGIIENASIVFDSDHILWVGREDDFPAEYEHASRTSLDPTQIKTLYFAGHTLTPELVDSHTHIIFGGDRSNEYAMRLNGASYEEIAAAGGGIIFTMKETNRLSTHELYLLGKERIEHFASIGIGTIEIKSGYGLNIVKEKEISEVIADLKEFFSPKIQIMNTFMAAHAVPKEFATSSEYMNKVVLPLLKKVKVDAVDIFFEKNYFDETDTRQLFTLARELGIPFKAHADEFNNNFGAKLGAELGALSVDHLLQTCDQGIAALAKSKTVATLLPGTGLFLGKTMANARKFLDNGVKVAIASDYNPGSCHCDNLLMLASIAAPMYKMNLGELWSAITLNAAHALGLYSQGAIIEGLKPRFTLFKCNSINQITYNWGKNLACNTLAR
ncbi:MAG: imidazolonepropionase [Oligoflexia bacterium]|nr:imidazolonepropionase [Oligoflexia bacterium]MBF0365557.1 imidazolonepropionase [Oligoflexia bacterium]